MSGGPCVRAAAGTAQARQGDEQLASDGRRKGSGPPLHAISGAIALDGLRFTPSFWGSCVVNMMNRDPSHVAVVALRSGARVPRKRPKFASASRSLSPR